MGFGPWDIDARACLSTIHGLMSRKRGIKTDGYATCLSRGTSKNGASVAFTARCASGPSCSKPFPQNGQFSNSPRLACLANHSPQCQHFTTAVTHILIFHLLFTDTTSSACQQGRRVLLRLSSQLPHLQSVVGPKLLEA